MVDHNQIFWWPIKTAPLDERIDLWCVPMMKETNMSLGMRHPDCYWDKSKQDWVRNDIITGSKAYMSTPSKDGTVWKAFYWTYPALPPGTGL